MLTSTLVVRKIVLSSTRLPASWMQPPPVAHDMVRTTRKRALPDIMRAYASGAFSNGAVSTIAATPLRTLSFSVSSPVAGSPVIEPSIDRPAAVREPSLA